MQSTHAANLGGSGGMLPRKVCKFTLSEIESHGRRKQCLSGQVIANCEQGILT